MNAALKCMVKSLLLIVVGGLLGALLLTIVFLVPVNEGNKAESLQILEEEGWYPIASVHKHAYSEHFHSYFPDVMDNNTDTIMISTALDVNEGNPLVRAMNMYSEYLDMNYSRYWHGYVGVLRPLLYFMDYGEVRIFNEILQILVMVFLVHMVWQKKGSRYAVLMLTSYALLMPMALAVSMQFSWVFYVGAFGCLALLAKEDTWGTDYKYIYLFVLIGMFTSYLDLLTYPLFTWGFPVVWWLLTDSAPTTRKGYLGRCFFSGIGWGSGYLGMWGLKWILGSVVTGQNVIEDAMGKVQEHAASAETIRFTWFDRLGAAYTNWKHYENIAYFLILIAWLVCLVVISLKKGWYFHKNNLALLVVAASSPAWYFVVAEHTRGHHFFTYRIWGVAILAIIGLLLQATEGNNDEREAVRVGRGSVFLMWVMAAVFGLLLTLTAREDLKVHNGAAETVEVVLDTSSCVEVEFIPTLSKVIQIGLIMKVTDTNGFCEITVSKEEKVLYQEQISLERFAESEYTEIGVEWKLKAGEQYTMNIHTVETREPVVTVLTIPAIQPLNELQNTLLDGREIGGQPVMGLVYYGLPVSRKTLLLLITCFGGACGAIILCMSEMFLEKRKVCLSRKTIAKNKEGMIS